MNGLILFMTALQVAPLLLVSGIGFYILYSMGAFYRGPKRKQTKVGTPWASDDDWAAFNFAEFWSEKN